MLGRGSFGIVKLAINKKLNAHFAVKCLPKKGIQGNKHVEHVINERQILMKLKGNAFCCTMVDTFQDEKSLYIVMEYLSGGELIKHIR